MTSGNRWQDSLLMACASCCWLTPLPPDWVGRVYGLDNRVETAGETLVGKSAGVAGLVDTADLADLADLADMAHVAGDPAAAGPSPVDSRRSRLWAGRRWGLRRTTPATAER